MADAMSAATRLLELARARGDEPWLLSAGGADSWACLARKAEDLAGTLSAAGAAAGDVCVVAGSHGTVSTAALLAAWSLRLAAAPVSARTEAETAARIASVPTKWILDCRSGTPAPVRCPGGGDHPLLARLRSEDAAGLILFSSGTSGTPKVVLHRFDPLALAHLARPARPRRIVATLGFDHIGGIDVLLGVLASGSTLVVPTGLDPVAVAECIERARAEVLPASPTMLSLMLASGAVEERDLSSLRVIAYGAEPMPPALLARVRAAFPGARVEQRFGTSETGALRTRDSGGPLFFRIDDPDTEWRVESGELWIRSPRTMLGYLSGPGDRLTAEGWYRTGDLVEAGPDGTLRITGRASEVINVGGEKVLPAEVEAHLLTIPGVEACHVRAEPHPLTGSVVAADIVWSDAPTPAEARARVRVALTGKVEPHKIPVRIRNVPSIGMTDRGKRQVGQT